MQIQLLSHLTVAILVFLGKFAATMSTNDYTTCDAVTYVHHTSLRLHAHVNPFAQLLSKHFEIFIHGTLGAIDLPHHLHHALQGITQKAIVEAELVNVNNSLYELGLIGRQALWGSWDCSTGYLFEDFEWVHVAPCRYADRKGDGLIHPFVQQCLDYAPSLRLELFPQYDLHFQRLDHSTSILSTLLQVESDAIAAERAKLCSSYRYDVVCRACQSSQLQDIDRRAEAVGVLQGLCDAVGKTVRERKKDQASALWGRFNLKAAEDQLAKGV